MKKLFLLIIIMISTLQGAAYAQTFEQVIKKFEDKKGADVVKLPGALMKMALAFADEDEDMPREALEFLKHVSSMHYLDMSECSSTDKAAFAEAMKVLKLDGFEAIDMKDIDTSRVFFHKGEKKNQMVLASYEGDNYSLTLMTGRFDEAVAAMYAAASNKKDENKKEEEK